MKLAFIISFYFREFQPKLFQYCCLVLSLNVTEEYLSVLGCCACRLHCSEALNSFFLNQL
jgi:hypothetical protein